MPIEVKMETGYSKFDAMQKYHCRPENSFALWKSTSYKEAV